MGEVERDGLLQAQSPTRLEQLGALAAMIFIAAVIIGTAFPALLRIF